MFFLLLLFSLAFMIIQPILPIFIQTLVGDGDASVPTGVIFSVAGMATVLAAPRWGKWGQKVGYTKVLRYGIIGGAVLSFLMAAARSLWLLGSMRFVFGLFLSAVMPSTNAIMARAVPASFRSRALAVGNSFGQVGGAVGPIMGGYIGQMFGLPAVFIATGICLGLVAIWINQTKWDKGKTATTTR